MSFTWSPLPTGAPLLLADDAEPQPSAPGSTLTALQAGGICHKWVAAFGGYDQLVSDAPAAAVVTAWAAGGDWNDALGNCLYVELENEQRANPWQPFGDGGTLTLRIAPDANDTFGIDTHRKTAGAETFLTSTVGASPDDDTLTVSSASNFDTTGTAYIGNEAILYSGKTATTLTGCTRGVYAPFANDTSGSFFAAGRFAQHHEVDSDPNAIRLKPVVSEQPRTWLGRWMGLWLHRWSEENQLLNTRADAQLVFAGRVVEIADDPSTACTVVECEHVNDYVKNAVIGKDMWSATLKEGVELTTGMLFDFSESDDGGATWVDADPLLVVASGATGANEINEGFYSHDEVSVALNTWWASELDAANIVGFYSIGLTPFDSGGGGGAGSDRTALSFNIPGASTVNFSLRYPERVSRFFGKLQTSGSGTPVVLHAPPDSEASTDHQIFSEGSPLRFVVADPEWPVIYVDNERGTFVDQAGQLPSETTNISSGGGEIGLFCINNSAIFGGLKIGDAISFVVPITSVRLSGQSLDLWEALGGLEATVDDNSSTITIRQILYYQDTATNILKKIFYTTGGDGVNHATYDVLPRPLGLGIPGELLGDDFEDSCDTIPGAQTDFTLVVDEPTKLADLFSGPLIFRWTFLRWINEHLEFCSWRAPTTGVALTESNKATAAGTQDDQRSATVLSDDWQRTTIKVDYDRDLGEFDGDGGFRSTLTLVDRVAIDDAGGAEKPITIQLRDQYGTEGVKALTGQFKSLATLFTRPVRRTVRTIDSRFFEGYSIGDCVIVTDEFARDPDTGQRRVAARPGIITRHQWTLGGAGPNGSVGDVGGEVELMFLDVNRSAQYVPAAQLDDTATNSGYVVGTKVATCYAHRYSESSEAADASYFTAGRKVRLIEIDPTDPAAPSTHDDTVASQTGNTVTLTDGFAGFDNTKLYKLVFDTYGDSTATQQSSFVYQADDTDAMIEDTRAPFNYTQGPLIVGTANSPTDLVELPANNTFGDGVGRDVFTEVACNRLLNQMLDLGCTMSLPSLGFNEMTGSIGVTWRLVDIRAIWLSAEELSAGCSRTLLVSPRMKSTSGTSNVRVSLVRHRPNATLLTNVNRGTILSDATFSTSSSTYVVPTAQSLVIRGVKNYNGFAYLLLECSAAASTTGLSICQESSR